MPQLIFKGIKKEELKIISKEILDNISKISNTPKDYFSFELINSEYYFEGESTKMYPLVEVKQFDRGKDVEKNMATLIAKAIKDKGYDYCEIYFIKLERESYYEF